MKGFVSLVVPLFITGCSSVATLSIVPNELSGQKTLYESGEPIVVSTKSADHLVAISSASEDVARENNYLALDVIYLNSSNRPLDINPSLIAAKLLSGQSVKVLSDVEHREALKKAYKGKRVALALQGVGAAFEGNKTAYHSGTINGQVYSGTTTYNTGNTKETQVVRESITNLNEAVRLKESFYLKRHTLMPGKEFVGRIWVSNPKTKEAREGERIISIPLGGETHVFSISVSVDEV
ncbi:MAG: hypothetical protein K6L73_15050 [Cellvibrionaceae bacterium]